MQIDQKTPVFYLFDTNIAYISEEAITLPPPLFRKLLKELNLNLFIHKKDDKNKAFYTLRKHLF